MTRGSASRWIAALLAAALMGAVLAGCAADDDTLGPSTKPSASPSATPTPGQRGPLRVSAASVVLGELLADRPADVSAASGTTPKHLDPATTRLLVDLPGSSEGWQVAITVTAPRGVTVAVGADGTLGLVDDTGLLRLGLAAPADGYRRINLGNLTTPFDDTVPRRGAVGDAWTVDDPEPSGHTNRTITLTTQIAAPGEPGSGEPGSVERQRVDQTAVVLGAGLIASVTWRPDGEDGGGSYVVTPTAWGRMAGEAGRETLFPALVAREPRADTDVLKKQLLCHAGGAPAKTTWNLEPWRPDVSELAYVLARCNPT